MTRILLATCALLVLSGSETQAQTRFYPSHSTAAGITPTPLAGWEDTTAFVVRTMAVTTPAASGSGSTSVTRDAAGNDDVLVYQQIICNLDAQTIDGTVKGQFRAAENNTGLNATMSFALWVSSSDGSTSRGTLVQTHADSVTAPYEFATSLTNRPILNASESTPITLSAVSAQAGDCLIFEVGYFAQPGVGSVIGAIGVTDNSGSDLAEDNTTTTANNSWIEFSDTITFGGAGPTGRPSIIGGGVF